MNETLQDRLQREAREYIKKNAIGIVCTCGGGGTGNDNETCTVCGGCGIYDWEVYKMDELVSKIISETIKAERAEWLRSEIEELEKRKFNVVDWLRNTYGLDDDDCLSAGRVQELCEMLVPDAFTSIITRYKEELKVLTGEYE